MRKNEITAKQKTCLENFGLTAPSKKKKASLLITFLLHDNGSGIPSVERRVAAAKALENKWLGRKVTIYYKGNRVARVVEYSARSDFEYKDISETVNAEGWEGKISPFEVLVRFDDNGYHQWFSISALKAVEEKSSQET